MTTDITPSTSPSVPVLPVLAGGAAAQLAGVAIGLVLPFPWLLAILLTAGAGRYVTREMRGAEIARTGLAVGGASALLGLLIGGFGFVAILLAGVTVVAGVVGAVAARA